MNDTGFVYVLINPSMEGLIKVGKTTRNPKERADELSKATGVPTPFIVAYELAVHNCSKAEEFVHTYLEAKGYRVASNREFFDAPLNVAIDAILEYKNIDVIDEAENDEDTSGLKYPSNPWDEFEMQASGYQYGFGEFLQNEEKALELYKKAAKLGSPTACKWAGYLYEHGEGCPKDVNKALEYYEEGAKRGDNECNASMMQLYFEIQHIDNAQKCWNRYIDGIGEVDQSDVWNFYNYLRDTCKYDAGIQRLDILQQHKEQIWNRAIEMQETWKASGGNSQAMNYISSVTRYIKTVLQIQGTNTSTGGGGTGCLLPILGLLLIGVAISSI